MSEYIELLNSGGYHFGPKSCTPDEYRFALQKLVDPSFKEASKLAAALGCHPLASCEVLERLIVPQDRRLDVVRAISGTPSVETYEMIVRLITNDDESRRRRWLNFAASFSSSPDSAGAQRIAHRLLHGSEDGRIFGISGLLAGWVQLGVLTEAQDAAIVESLLERAEVEPGWCGVIGKLPTELAVPWLLVAAEDTCPETAAMAIGGLCRHGHEPPERLMAEISHNSVRAGALFGEVGDHIARLSAVNPDFRLAATQARAGLAWKYVCEAGFGHWTSDDPVPDIEQLGIVDGESAETAGIIFVFRCRLPAFGDDKWIAGISGPYSVGEDPARHLGGLDYTDVAVGSRATTVADQVEELIGVRLHFSALAAKPNN